MRAAALVLCVLGALWFHFRPVPRPPPPRWHDPVFRVPVDRPMPYFDLVAYRAALEAGFRYRAGWDVQAGDTAERSPVATWTVGPRALPFTLRFRFDRVQGKVEALAEGTAGQATLRAWLAGPKVDPVRAARDALDDLPAAARLLGEALPAPASVAPASGPPAVAGGVDDLADALLPLRQDPTAGELARAARALAWQALLDARLAPVLAPQRAAQALALAEVAERRGVAGAAREHLAVARWLAPPAALGDAWVLSLTGPPASAPELSPLSAAYVIHDLPRERPASWNLPFLVAFTERAVALDAPYAVPRLLTWSAGSRFAGLAARYVAMTGELGAVTRHALRCLRGPLADAARVPGLPPLPPDLVELLSGPPPADPLVVLAPANVGRVVRYARAVLAAAARTPTWPERVLLEEAGEQLLQALVPLYDVADHHRWLHPLRAMADAFRAARFDHPVINALAEHLPGDRVEGAHVEQLARFPGVAARRPWQRSRDDAARAAGHARAALALWGAFPAAAFRAAQCEADAGAPYAAAVLADWLLRAHGPRAPFAGDTIAFPPAERAWRAEVLPVEARRAPAIAARVAQRLHARGRKDEARRLLADTLGLEPAAERAVIERVRQACADGQVGAAREVVGAMIAAQPAGLGWARAQGALAESAALTDGRVALVAARAAASSMDEGLISLHMGVAAALGAEDDVESAHDRLQLAGVAAERERTYRAAAAVMAAARRGPVPASLWSALATAPVPIDVRLAGLMVRALDRLRVPPPADRRLALRLAIQRPRERVTLDDLRAVRALVPADVEGRAVVQFAWVELVGGLFETPDADALPDAELEALLTAVEPVDAFVADHLLRRLATRDVSAHRLARAARRLAAVVPRADAALLAWAGASPQRARLWTALASLGSPDNARNLATWLALHGRDQESRELSSRLPDDEREARGMRPELLAPYVIRAVPPASPR